LKLSQRNPSVNCCSEKRNGIDAKASCEGSLDLAMEAVPVARSNPPAVKLAVAEKHIILACLSLSLNNLFH
jgi:hypothetical protein